MWNLNKNYRLDRFLATEMDFWRRSAIVTRTEHIRNETYMQLRNVENNIINKIEKKNSYGGIDT